MWSNSHSFDSLSGPGIDNVYDGFGRMSSSINRMGGSPLTITHADRKGFTCRYDQLNRETRLRRVGGGYVKNAYCNNCGQMRPMLIGRGGLTDYSYDAVGRLNRMVNQLAGTDADNRFHFGYSPTSQAKSRTISNDHYTNSALITYNHAPHDCVSSL